MRVKEGNLSAEAAGVEDVGVEEASVVGVVEEVDEVERDEDPDLVEVVGDGDAVDVVGDVEEDEGRREDEEVLRYADLLRPAVKGPC